MSSENLSIKSKKVPDLVGEVTIDGEADEAIWNDAASEYLLYENRPSENGPAQVKTLVRYFTSNETIYINFVAYDSFPELIRAFYNDRDNSWNDDQVAVMIDTFGDRRRAHQFFVNPLGVQSDTVMNDIVRREDPSWDAIWRSAGVITEDGYSVEIAIPMRILRFNESLTEQRWGLEFARFYPRQQSYRLSSIKRYRGEPCNICNLNDYVGFSANGKRSQVDIIPTLTISNSESKQNPISDPWVNERNSEFGIDARWAINPDNVLNVTINPDFSQVEADVAQLDVNTQFSLFFPERRTFFVEGAEYFQSPNRLVYTRNIANPENGVKLTGKQSSNSYGLIYAHDPSTQFLVGSSQSSTVISLENLASDAVIGRFSHDFLERDSIGLTITERTGNGYSNKLAAIDSLVWFSDSTYAQTQVMSSKSEFTNSDYNFSQSEIDELNRDGDALTVRLRHEKEAYSYYYDYNYFEQGFRADLGFINRVDFKKHVLGTRRNWYFDNSFLTRFTVRGDVDQTKTTDGQEIEKEKEVYLEVTGANEFRLTVGGGERDRLVETEFSLTRLDDQSETLFLLQDRFIENFLFAQASYRFIPSLKFNISANLGDAIDFYNVLPAKRKNIRPSMEWRPTRSLRVDLNYQDEEIEVNAERLFRAKLLDMRAAYQFDLRHRLRLNVQYLDLKRNPDLYRLRYRNISQINDFDTPDLDETRKSLSAQIIYSYELNPQSLVFLGFSTRGYQEPTFDDIEFDSRSVFAKFSYAFELY